MKKTSDIAFLILFISLLILTPIGRAIADDLPPPDGSVSGINPDGSISGISPDGSVSGITPDGSISGIDRGDPKEIDTVQDVLDVIDRITNWMFTIFLALAVIMILYAAFVYLTSGGG